MSLCLGADKLGDSLGGGTLMGDAMHDLDTHKVGPELDERGILAAVVHLQRHLIQEFTFVVHNCSQLEQRSFYRLYVACTFSEGGSKAAFPTTSNGSPLSIRGIVGSINTRTCDQG